MNCLYISDAFWGGLIGSFATWLFLFFGQRMYNWSKLFRFNDEYNGFEMDGTPHDTQKSYTAHFSFWKNKLILRLSSQTKGSWEAQIPISSWSPTTGIGNYFYLRNGNYSDDWGIMQVWLNRKEKIITIEASSRNSEGKGLAKYNLREK